MLKGAFVKLYVWPADSSCFWNRRNLVAAVIKGRRGESRLSWQITCTLGFGNLWGPW